MGNHVYNTYSDSFHENTGCSPILHSLVACFSVPPFAINTVGVLRPLGLPILEEAFDQPPFLGRETQCDKIQRQYPLESIFNSDCFKRFTDFLAYFEKRWSFLSRNFFIRCHRCLSRPRLQSRRFTYISNLDSRVHSAKRTRFKTYWRRWYLLLCTFLH